MIINIKRDNHLLMSCEYLNGINIGSGYCTDKCIYNKGYNEKEKYVICWFIESLRLKKLNSL